VGPLLRALSAAYPARTLVLTASTATGKRQAERLYADLADVRYLPYDLPGAVTRFLDRSRPAAGIVIETELWPTLYRICGRRQIPLLVASARLSPRSFRRYRRMPRFIASVLGDSHIHVAAQSEEDAARFRQLGAAAQRTTVCGNIKYDQTIPTAALEGATALRASLGADRPVWVAGSTHDGEEQIVLAAHALLQNRGRPALLVLAPRHPPRFDGVSQLLQQQGWRYERRSARAAVSSSTQVLLLDTLGELVAYYASADLAFVGGSLVPIGGHNLLEPLRVGRPVLTGPSTGNDAVTASLLLECGAAQTVTDAQTLADALLKLWDSPDLRHAAVQAGERVLLSNQGAVRRVCAALGSLIAVEDAPGVSVL
jgi:3-deoxy-D-manno-octulosonic-acid transferase